MGLAPPYPSGRAFRDLAGWPISGATTVVEIYLVIAGIPVDLKQ